MRNDPWAHSRSAAARAELAPIPPDNDFNRDRDVYLDQLQAQYHDLDLYHTSALAPRGRGAWSIPLGDVFVPPSVRDKPLGTELPPEVRQRFITSGPRSERRTTQNVGNEHPGRGFGAYADTPRRPALEVISKPDNRRIVLLGAPGAGKSTLAAYLMLTLAELAIDPGTHEAGHPHARLAR
jgi:hypothetical protein